MRRPRCKYAAVFKGDETLAALAEKFDAHPNQITQWNPMPARTKSSKASRSPLLYFSCYGRVG